MKTIAYLYRWTELSTGKWYEGSRSRIGCHPNDGYICSSELVKKLITENRCNWKRDILVIGDPHYIRELEFIRLSNLDAARDPMSYNRDNGNGAIGFCSNGKRWMRFDNQEELISEKLWDYYLDNDWKFGRSSDIKQILYLANLNNIGEDNPAFGRKWMTNGEINRLADELDQQELLLDGWYYGVNSNTKNKIGDSSKSYYKNRSKEKEQKHNSELSKATRNYHKNLTSEEYDARRLKCSQATLNAYNNMTEEQKNAVILRLNDSTKNCKFCGITTNPGNYNRWHGDKCKRKTNENQD